MFAHAMEWGIFHHAAFVSTLLFFWKKKTQSAPKPEVSIIGNFSAEIRGEYYSRLTASPDGKYLVAIKSGSENSNGAVAVIGKNDLRIVCIIEMERPHKVIAVLSDTVIVEDWTHNYRTSKIVSLKLDGTIKWTRKFNAATAGFSASSTGGCFTIQTAASEFEEHSGKTFMLKSDNADVVWVIDDHIDVVFEGDSPHAKLEWPNGSISRYPILEAGALPTAFYDDAAKIYDEKNRGDYYYETQKAQDALSEEPPDIGTAQKSLENVMTSGKIPEGGLAVIYRLLGEISEYQGNYSDTLRYWKMALEINEKIGIKRRYESLKKKIGE